MDTKFHPSFNPCGFILKSNEQLRSNEESKGLNATDKINVTVKFNHNIEMMVHHEAMVQDNDMLILQESVWGFSQFRDIVMPCVYSKKCQKKFFVCSHIIDSFFSQWKTQTLYDKLKAVDAVLGEDILYCNPSIVFHFRLMGVSCPSICRLVSEDVTKKLCDLYDTLVTLKHNERRQNEKFLEKEVEKTIQEEGAQPTRNQKSVSPTKLKISVGVNEKQKANGSHPDRSQLEDNPGILKLHSLNQSSMVHYDDKLNQAAKKGRTSSSPSPSLFQSANLTYGTAEKLPLNRTEGSTITTQSLHSLQMSVSLPEYNQHQQQSVSSPDHSQSHQQLTNGRVIEIQRWDNQLSVCSTLTKPSMGHEKNQDNIQSCVVGFILVDHELLFRWLVDCHMNKMAKLPLAASLEQRKLENAEKMKNSGNPSESVEMGKGIDNTSNDCHRVQTIHSVDNAKQTKFKHLLQEAMEEMSIYTKNSGIAKVAFTGSAQILENLTSELAHYKHPPDQVSAIYKVNRILLPIEGKQSYSSSSFLSNGPSVFKGQIETNEEVDGQSGLKVWIVKDIHTTAVNDGQISTAEIHTYDRVHELVNGEDMDFTVKLCKEIENNIKILSSVGKVTQSPFKNIPEGSNDVEAGNDRKLCSVLSISKDSPSNPKENVAHNPVVSPLLISKIVNGKQTNYQIRRVLRKKQMLVEGRKGESRNTMYSEDRASPIVTNPTHPSNSAMQETLDETPANSALKQRKRLHKDISECLENHKRSTTKVFDEQPIEGVAEFGQGNLNNQSPDGQWTHNESLQRVELQDFDFPLQETVIMMSSDILNKSNDEEMDDDQPIDLRVSSKLNIKSIHEGLHRGHYSEDEKLTSIQKAISFVSESKVSMNNTVSDLTSHISILSDSLTELIKEVLEARKERIELQNKLSNLKRNLVLPV